MAGAKVLDAGLLSRLSAAVATESKLDSALPGRRLNLPLFRSNATTRIQLLAHMRRHGRRIAPILQRQTRQRQQRHLPRETK